MEEKINVTFTEHGVAVEICADGKMHLDMMVASLIASLFRDGAYTIADMAENTARAMEILLHEDDCGSIGEE